MKILILTDDEIRALLPMDVCIELMAGALESLAKGAVHQPLRMIVRPPGAAGLLGLMPAYRTGASGPVFGLKTIGVFPGNVARGLDAHQGSVMLLDGETGQPRAVLNASAITEIRTAAVSGVATRVLARADAGDLAILGSGVQARSHLAAMACVRRLRRVRVASRSFEHARSLASEAAARNTCPVEAVPDIQAALRGADLVVTATSAAAPVVQRAWISAGAHINAVGASTPAARELDAATVAAARLFVDRRESALAEAGDYLMAVQEGSIGPDHIQAEIGEVLVGARPGRRGDGDITVFKSVGLAVEDLAAAEFLHRAAQEEGVGTWVTL
jgi:ornithine cyclodeaminase